MRLNLSRSVVALLNTRRLAPFSLPSLGISIARHQMARAYKPSLLLEKIELFEMILTLKTR